MLGNLEMQKQHMLWEEENKELVWSYFLHVLWCVIGQVHTQLKLRSDQFRGWFADENIFKTLGRMKDGKSTLALTAGDQDDADDDKVGAWDLVLKQTN
jgi:hypothetical protein